MRWRCRWMRSTRRRLGRSRSGMGIRRPCTCGGLGGRWLRVGRCCSLRWWTTRRVARIFFRLWRLRLPSGSGCSGLSSGWLSGRTATTRTCWLRRTRRLLIAATASCRRSLTRLRGGGAIPLEAQRFGLEAHASDLNPVAVLINKAQIEIPPRFAGCPPVHPGQEGAAQLRSWSDAQCLASDVEFYGRWMRDEAERRIGHLYPKIAPPPPVGAMRPRLLLGCGRGRCVLRTRRGTAMCR